MRYAKIYRGVAWEPKISMSAKAVYAALAQFANKEHRCWPSRPRLIEKLGCTNRTLTKALNELRLWGVIQWTKGFSGRANIYTLCDEKAAASLERGEVPIVADGSVLQVSANENHSSSSAKEEPAQYGT